jgi:hypothetical protein
VSAEEVTKCEEKFAKAKAVRNVILDLFNRMPVAKSLFISLLFEVV